MKTSVALELWHHFLHQKLDVGEQLRKTFTSDPFTQVIVPPHTAIVLVSDLARWNASGILAHGRHCVLTGKEEINMRLKGQFPVDGPAKSSLVV